MYGRHAGAFLLTSGLLWAPLAVIRLVTTKWGYGRDGLSLLDVPELFGALFAYGALALLAAELRVGGDASWRLSWARALSRARPIITSALFGLTPVFLLGAVLGAVPAVLISSVCAASGHRVSSVEFIIYFSAVLCAPYAALVTIVAPIEGIGGFAAAHRAHALLKGDTWRKVAFLMAVTVPLYAVQPLLRLLLPARPSWVTLLVGIVSALANPAIAIVSLDVYRAARAARDATGDTELRADVLR